MKEMEKMCPFNKKFVENVGKIEHERHLCGWKRSRGDGN